MFKFSSKQKDQNNDKKKHIFPTSLSSKYHIEFSLRFCFHVLVLLNFDFKINDLS